MVLLPASVVVRRLRSLNPMEPVCNSRPATGAQRSTRPWKLNPKTATRYLLSLYIAVTVGFIASVLSVWSGDSVWLAPAAYYPTSLALLLSSAFVVVFAVKFARTFQLSLVLLVLFALVVVGIGSLYKIGRADTMCVSKAPPQDRSLVEHRAEPLGFPDGRASCKWSRGTSPEIEEETHYSIFQALAA